MTRKVTVRFASKSAFKRQEIPEILRITKFDVARRTVAAEEKFRFEFSDVVTDEPLERELEQMVRHKARSAYPQLMAPCIVEHAGLILEPYLGKSYPGGLTQPMWDALEAEEFARSISWASRRALARSVVGYCDGLKIRTFVGETWGTIVDSPRGSRGFYWDTIFCPDGGDQLTYAEISTMADGLEQKVRISQFTKAMQSLFKYIAVHGTAMFPDV